MSFSADWLALRAPADNAARDPGLRAAAAAFLRDGIALDLGCGIGAAATVFPRARWRLVDRDPVLLRAAAAHGETIEADLARLDAIPFDGARLVTAFALLDLAGRDWIEQLADRVAAEGAGFYAPLSYDGEMAWHPPLPDDAAVRAAFNADQRRDKGLGPALGPGAAAAMAAALARRGHAVRLAPSPWRLGPGDAALHAEFVAGIAAATGAQAWAQARRATATSCIVGHLDLLALPSSTQSNTTSLPNP